MKKSNTTRRGSTAVMNGPASIADVLRRTFSQLREVDAVFLSTDDLHVVHVYSVVRDFQSKTYDKLLRAENEIERDFSEIALEFHVRAHQGRKPAACVPFDAEAVFVR